MSDLPSEIEWGDDTLRSVIVERSLRLAEGDLDVAEATRAACSTGWLGQQLSAHVESLDRAYRMVAHDAVAECNNLHEGRIPFTRRGFSQVDSALRDIRELPAIISGLLDATYHAAIIQLREAEK